jgi:DNA invertase Pin-like site-specific DNA recombinase
MFAYQGLRGRRCICGSAEIAKQRESADRIGKLAERRGFDVLLICPMDRLGRSVLHVAQAMAELDAAGVALISEQQGIDGTGRSGGP